MKSILLEFSGKVTEKELQTDYIEVSNKDLLNSLKENSKNISYEICSRINRNTGLECDATIIFQKGSIEWLGFVEVFYKSIEVMSNLSGAIGLIKIIQSSINSVIKKNFEQLLNNNIRDHSATKDSRKYRIEPTFDITTSVKNVSLNVSSSASDDSFECSKKTCKKIIIKKEKNNTLLYMLLFFAVITSVVAFITLALVLVDFLYNVRGY